MNDTVKALFGAVLAALYLIIGSLQILMAVIGPFPGLEGLCLYGNFTSVFALLVIGAVLASGVSKLFRGVEEGSIFVSVGILLSVAFGLVALLSLCATGIDTLLTGEEAGWSIAESVSPLLYLGAIGAVGFAAWERGFFRGLCAA